jgi:hypothetical protein
LLQLLQLEKGLQQLQPGGRELATAWCWGASMYPLRNFRKFSIMQNEQNANQILSGKRNRSNNTKPAGTLYE